MARTHGIVEETPQRLVYGAGVAIRDYDKTATIASQASNKMGATKGGSEITIVQELVYPEIDGALGKIKGTARLKRDTATAKINFIDLDLDTLLDALPGAVATDGGTGTVTITRSRHPEEADHDTNIAVVTDSAAADGSIGFILHDPLATGDLVATLADDFAVLAIEFEAHYDASTPDVRPWEIIYPSPSVVS
ncbi:MAG: hypothetical protein ABFC80_04095 [Coriobacteriales bacterium]